MLSQRTSIKTGPESVSRYLCVAALAAFVFSGLPYAEAVVVFDDFSDLNDTANPTWNHLDGLVGSTGQTWDASTGQYRLIAPSNGMIPEAPEFNFLGAAGGYVTPSFTDVRVEADFVDFQVGEGGPVFYGIAARLDGNNSPPSAENGFALRGYGYVYEPSGGAAGEMVLYLFTGEGTQDVRSAPAILDDTKDYKFVLEVIGNVLHGQTFELDAQGEIVSMVAENIRDFDAEPQMVDHDGNPSTPEILHEPYTSGFSGIVGVGYIIQDDMDLDFTIDNFRSESIGLTGDYNEDGIVNAADYTVWRDGGSPDDSQAGYDLWKANFGNSGSGSGSAAVPEPASAALVVAGVIALWVGRRRAD